MANVKKFSAMQAIGHLCKHYERSVEPGHYGNPDIDQDKLYLDHVNLAPDRGKQTDYIKEKIDEIMAGKTLRKDAVRMCCWVVDKPKNLPTKKEMEFFKETYNFLIERYGTKSGMGEDVCISAYIHHSETTDHIHFAFLPVIERNGKKTFCEKEVIGRSDLKTFHEDLANYLEKKGICKRSDILNGATIRDSSGRALSVNELKKKGSREREKASRWRQTDNNRNRTKGRWN